MVAAVMERFVPKVALFFNLNPFVLLCFLCTLTPRPSAPVPQTPPGAPARPAPPCSVPVRSKPSHPCSCPRGFIFPCRLFV